MEEISLCLAAAQGDIREVQRLLKMGVDIDAAVPPLLRNAFFFSNPLPPHQDRDGVRPPLPNIPSALVAQVVTCLRSLQLVVVPLLVAHRRYASALCVCSAFPPTKRVPDFSLWVGTQPLMRACFEGHVAVAKLLLQHGADPTLRVSPYDLGRRQHHSWLLDDPLMSTIVCVVCVS